MGLWLVQESRRQWQKEGQDLSYDQISELAKSARPFAAVIDPNNPSFLAPGNMPDRFSMSNNNLYFPLRKVTSIFYFEK